MKIIIIGAGAGGLYLATLLKKRNINNVTILEKNDKIGQKLLLTGNGKCNLTNTSFDNLKDIYNNEFGINVVRRCDSQQILFHFKSLGLDTYEDSQGRVYPLANTSNSVLDVLRYNTSATIVTNCEVNDIKLFNNMYQVLSKKGFFSADIVIFACGGKSYYKQANVYDLMTLMNHSISPLYPSLIGIKTKQNLASIANLRLKVKASIYLDNELRYFDKGEVLFKKDGLSGIVIFQLSHFFNSKKNNIISLDLMPEYSLAQIEQMIENKNELYNDLDIALSLIFPKMIAKYLLKEAKSQEINELAYLIKNLKFDAISTYDFEHAQVTKGGVNVHEINNETMESIIHKNLYFVGECLDVNGVCGGYNLHFAWASATLCADAIAERVKKND